MALNYPDLFIDLANTLLREAHANGGATLDPVGKGTPATGYMVGGLVPSLVLYNGSDYDSERLAGWIADNWTMGEYVGSWRDNDTGYIHIDIVTHVRDYDFAIRLGKSREEIAIWDVSNETEIRLANIGTV